MAAELNETFMVRTGTPELTIDDPESLSIQNIKTKLTQLQLKATLSNDDNPHVQTQRSPLPAMELLILPKAQVDIEVIIFVFSFSSFTDSL